MKNSIKQYLKIIFYPIIIVRRAIIRKKNLNLAKKYPFQYLNNLHKKYYKKPLDLKFPKTLHEKIYWMEYNTDTSLWTKLTDKIAVREYVKKCGYTNILNEIYAVHSNLPDDLELIIQDLPNQFVLKTNNSGGGSAIIVRDKRKINKKKIYRKLKYYYYDDYGRRTAQPHYSAITTYILAEKLLIDNNNPQNNPNDYKFFCFNGNPIIVNVISNRNIETHSYIDQYYTTSWERIYFGVDDSTLSINKPSSYEEMLSIAKKLSSPFPFVRVDLYQIDDKPIFGELTFTPGFDNFCHYGEKVLHLGDMVNIAK